VTRGALDGPIITRRSLLAGAGAAMAFALAGCTSGSDVETPSGSGSPTSATGTTSPAVAEPTACANATPSTLWGSAMPNGIVYGSSAATWQIEDREYERLYEREAAILFTEDDLLWYRLRPTPTSDLDFSYGDRIVDFAEGNGMLVLGAHLVWDEGFGEGWSDNDLWGMSRKEATDTLYGTVEATVKRYRGRVAAWIVANEVVDEAGPRTNVPWHETIGPSYVRDAFEIARDADPDAQLLINDYGFETDDDGNAEFRRESMIDYLDELLADDVPVTALGVQAHLRADGFADAFDAEAYRAFLRAVADRGLDVLVTEMDVLDDGLPAEAGPRDAAIADVVSRYLETALAEPVVSTVVSFGLSDRYTWLEEDYPRDDGVPRRPLAFDEEMQPKPAFDAYRTALAGAAPREPLWLPPRC
jgi:endo-1,4-beta-xylanase